MSLGGGQQSPISGGDKYSQIMELMRLKQAMTPSSYTGGYNAMPSAVYATPSNYYDELLLRQQQLANANRGGGGGDRDVSDGFVSESPMAGRGPSTFGGNLALALDAYGNALGGFLPGGFLANMAAQAMLPSVTVNEARANQARLAELVAANPTYGGGGYGTPVGSGGYGVTSATGAGIASNPMSVDPATAQGQQSYGGPESSDLGGYSSPAGSDSGSSGAFGGGFGDGDFGGGDGLWAKGGRVTKNRLHGPDPMGPDDGFGGLDDGEFVIKKSAVNKYGIELMNAINAGKISKGKLRGLLEG